MRCPDGSTSMELKGSAVGIFDGFNAPSRFLLLRLQLRNQAVVRKPQQGKAGKAWPHVF